MEEDLVRVLAFYNCGVSKIESLDTVMAKGCCLCGAVEFEVDLIAGQVYSCHCSLCQRSHGAAFATLALAEGGSLTFIDGEDKLTDYFSGGGFRAFCSICGSRLMNYAKDKNQYLSVMVSCLENKDELAPVANVCIETKPDWNPLASDIPAYEGIPQKILAAVE